MALKHSVTVADVQRIAAEESAMLLNIPGVGTSVKKTPAEVRQGVRTRVHELIAAQSPCEYVLPPPARVFLGHEGDARNADIAARKAALAASIPEALVLESERARSGPDGTHRDAVHYVQKKWGMSVWQEADRLVALADASPGGLGGPIGGKTARAAYEEPDCRVLSCDGTAALDFHIGDPFEPLNKLVGKVWETAKQAMEDIAKALGGDKLFSWSNSGETSMWDLIFQNTNFAQAPVIQGSATAGSFYIALHTASPGQSGTQSTSEAAYTSYARVAVARSSGGWTITGNNPITAENAAAVTFPTAGSGPEVETYFSFGSLSSGAGVVYGFGALTSSLTVNNGITPSFAINALQCSFT